MSGSYCAISSTAKMPPFHLKMAIVDLGPLNVVFTKTPG